MAKYRFRVLGAEDTDWDEAWASLQPSSRDVFYTREYALLNQNHVVSPHLVRAAVAVEHGAVILYPFVLRRLVDLPGLSWADSSLHDIRGLYGRSGPVGAITNRAFTGRFGASLASYLGDHNVISSFDRLHPLVNKELQELGQFERRMAGEEVVVDLQQDEATLWRSFGPSVRKNCKKAIARGVTCRSDNGNEAWREFKNIYWKAMMAKQAASFYHFSSNYFEEIRRTLADYHTLYIAEVGGRVVSTELVLHSQEYGHSFLGGTTVDALDLQPNTLLKINIINDLRRRGVGRFVLGGGVTPGDGVFCYKRSYAPLGVIPSSLLVGLHDATAYTDLRLEYEGHFGAIDSGRFQFYDRS